MKTQLSNKLARQMSIVEEPLEGEFPYRELPGELKNQMKKEIEIFTANINDTQLKDL